MKKLLLNISFVLLLSVIAGEQAYGQLITDSDSRLKSVRQKERSGAVSSRSKKGGYVSTGGAHAQPYRGGAPRYSPPSPFTSFNKRKASQSRSVSGSAEMAFSKSPRKSGKAPATSTYGSPSLLATLFPSKTNGSRSATGSPYTAGRRSGVSPKYSPPSPFTGADWSWMKPRFSVNSKNRFYVDEKLKATPPESVVNMEYSGFMRKQKKWFADLNDLSRSTKMSDAVGPVRVPLYWPLETPEATEYDGGFKMKWVRTHNMHPSANYLHAHQDSELMRESLRKWNILWTHVNRNKVQPDAVTDKISKPKFDRKEAEIWNE